MASPVFQLNPVKRQPSMIDRYGKIAEIADQVEGRSIQREQLGLQNRQLEATLSKEARQQQQWQQVGEIIKANGGDLDKSLAEILKAGFDEDIAKISLDAAEKRATQKNNADRLKLDQDKFKLGDYQKVEGVDDEGRPMQAVRREGDLAALPPWETPTTPQSKSADMQAYEVWRKQQPLDADSSLVAFMKWQKGSTASGVPHTVTTAAGVLQYEPATDSWKKIGDRPPSAASENEPPVAVMGPNGKPVLVRRAESYGRTPANTREQGRNVTSGDANRIADFDTSLDDLAALRTEIGTTGATGNRAKAGAMLPDFVTDLTGLGTDAKKKQAVIDRVKQVIGKALEGGVLRKEDEYKYEKILPKIADTSEVVQSKLNGLEAAIKQRRETLIDSLDDANFDVSRYRVRPSGGGAGGGSLKNVSTDELLKRLLK